MAKNQEYRKRLDGNGNPVLVNGDFVLDLISEVTIGEAPKIAGWAAMRDALFANSAIIQKIMLNAKPNWWSAIQGEILAGMMGHGSEATLQSLLSDKNGQGVRLMWNTGAPDWTNGERTTINQYFTNHDFNITIAA